MGNFAFKTPADCGSTAWNVTVSTMDGRKSHTFTTAETSPGTRLNESFKLLDECQDHKISLQTAGGLCCSKHIFPGKGGKTFVMSYVVVYVFILYSI